MCEDCSKNDVTVTKLDDDEESDCEWFSEEESPGSCHKAAAYSVSAWYVEDHLCDAHKNQTEKEMEEGLADFLEGAGFSSQFEIRPRSEEHTSELQSHHDLVCRLLLEKKKYRTTWPVLSRLDA